MKKIILMFLIPLSIYAQGINTLITKAQLDSALATFYTYTDTKQLIVKHDTLIISDTASGLASFDTTATSDSIAITGIDSLDVVVVTPHGQTYNINDVLFVDEHTGYFKVYRNSSGTSGLKYSYIWIHKYQ